MHVQYSICYGSTLPQCSDYPVSTIDYMQDFNTIGVRVITLNQSPNMAIEMHGTQRFQSTTLASKYCTNTANCNCVAQYV